MLANPRKDASLTDRLQAAGSQFDMYLSRRGVDL